MYWLCSISLSIASTQVAICGDFLQVKGFFIKWESMAKHWNIAKTDTRKYYNIFLAEKLLIDVKVVLTTSDNENNYSVDISASSLALFFSN